MLWRACRAATNAARARVRLPPRGAVWTYPPMVYGVSPSLVPAPADWAADVYLCGQWLATSPAWTPPPALADFLAAGEAPIYIGFGSMAGFDGARLLHALIEALAGRRALFSTGWGGIDPNTLPGNVLAIGDTPHDWLFPRTAAAIHHGGSGTSHSAARAGVPSIVIPFAGGQLFWVERLRRAGVASARRRTPPRTRGIGPRARCRRHPRDASARPGPGRDDAYRERRRERGDGSGAHRHGLTRVARSVSCSGLAARQRSQPTRPNSPGTPSTASTSVRRRAEPCWSASRMIVRLHAA